ncbi:hypothetical protein MC885_007516 [Smutsia gigantea]|nr:hypothetical protein MC885_007516 [Smutsia gigantea]
MYKAGAAAACCSAWDGSARKAASPSRAPSTATHPGFHPPCQLGRNRRTLTYSPVPVGFFLSPPSGTASQPPGSSVSRTHCQELAPLHTQHIVQGNQRDSKEQDTGAKGKCVPRTGTEGPQLPGMGLSPNSCMRRNMSAESLLRGRHMLALYKHQLIHQKVCFVGSQLGAAEGKVAFKLKGCPSWGLIFCCRLCFLKSVFPCSLMFYFTFSFLTDALKCVGNVLHLASPCANDQLTGYVTLFRAESMWYKSCARNSVSSKSFREKCPCSLPSCLCLRNTLRKDLLLIKKLKQKAQEATSPLGYSRGPEQEEISWPSCGGAEGTWPMSHLTPGSCGVSLRRHE